MQDRPYCNLNGQNNYTTADMKYNIIITILCIGFAGCRVNQDKTSKLPIRGERLGTTNKMVDGKTITDTIYHTIPDFKVLNQDSQIISQDALNGKIYVADFFFTSCPTICPITEANMLKVQKKFKDQPDLKIISFTIDPRHDSAYVLKEYASRLGADTKQWYFVRGDADQTYELAQKGFLSSALKDSASPGGYAHSGAFILVDKEKRIRGIYNGTDSTDVNRLIRDIPVLLEEYRTKQK
jgi:protein SCO1